MVELINVSFSCYDVFIQLPIRRTVVGQERVSLSLVKSDGFEPVIIVVVVTSVERIDEQQFRRSVSASH